MRPTSVGKDTQHELGQLARHDDLIEHLFSMVCSSAAAMASKGFTAARRASGITKGQWSDPAVSAITPDRCSSVRYPGTVKHTLATDVEQCQFIAVNLPTAGYSRSLHQSLLVNKSRVGALSRVWIGPAASACGSQPDPRFAKIAFTLLESLWSGIECRQSSGRCDSLQQSVHRPFGAQTHALMSLVTSTTSRVAHVCFADRARR